MSDTIKIIIKPQVDTCLFWSANDDGRFSAMTCRRGVEKMIGRKIRPGELLTAELTLREIDHLPPPMNDEK